MLEELGCSSFETDLFGENVKDDLRLLLLKGVDTPEEPAIKNYRCHFLKSVVFFPEN